MKNRKIFEATGTSSSGKFKVPIVLSPEVWTKSQLQPFLNPAYSYTNAELAYEEADGDFKQSPEMREKIEKRTRKISKLDQYLKQFYSGQNDEEGGNIASVDSPENVIKQVTGPLKEEKSFLNEDLAVWFGTKKKPKGSKQPKGPWVNICRKVNGKHPPCGRDSAKTKGYPKCRATHVASKMSDSEKKSACQQKRRAEKKSPKYGKGNKPTMVSHKSKNEGLEKIIKRVLREQYDTKRLYVKDSLIKRLSILGAPSEIKNIARKLPEIPCENNVGERNVCVRIPEIIHVFLSGKY